MARRGTVTGPPRSFVQRGGTWPDGPFTPGTPPEILHAAHVATRLRQLTDESTVVALACTVGVTRSALHGILNGSRWPDAVSIARIELATDQPVWPVHMFTPAQHGAPKDRNPPR
jgi:hypothetical protein